MFKENTAYFILALVAIVLIGITIGLQVVILSDQPGSTETVGNVTGAQPNDSSNQVQSNGVTQSGGTQAGAPQSNTQNGGIQVSGQQVNTDAGNTTNSLGNQIGMADPQPTATPGVIVLDPTSPPPSATEPPTATPPTATPPPVEATSTPMPTTEQPQAQVETQAETQAEEVEVAVASTEASTQASTTDISNDSGQPATSSEAPAQEAPAQEDSPTSATEAAPTDTRVAPLPTPTAKSDIVFGYADRGRNCTIMTQAVAQIMGQRLGVTVSAIMYSNANDMMMALADQSIDLTLCYVDPDDRKLMREFLGDIRQVGTQHMVGEDYKLQLWANGASKAQLRDDRPCVLDFLEKIDFTSVNIDSNSLDSFVPVNGATIEQWLDCPYQ